MTKVMTMSKWFQVIVEFVGTVAYVVEADDEAQAAAKALEESHHTISGSCLDVISRSVVDIADETEEHS